MTISARGPLLGRDLEVRVLTPDEYEAAVPALATLLVDAVDGGAAVNFVAGVTTEEAAGWWTERILQVADGTISAFVAAEAGRDVRSAPVVGSTLLIRSRNPNAPHRAEIGKVLVHSSARRHGIGRALMVAAEELARSEGRWLVVLDTQAGTPAEAFYRQLGWVELGTMPNHSYRTDGVLAPTAFFWKDLRGAPGREGA